MRYLSLLIPLALAAPAAADPAECAALKRSVEFQGTAMDILTATLTACLDNDRDSPACRVVIDRVGDLDVDQWLADTPTMLGLATRVCAD